MSKDLQSLIQAAHSLLHAIKPLSESVVRHYHPLSIRPRYVVTDLETWMEHWLHRIYTSAGTAETPSISAISDEEYCQSNLEHGKESTR